MEATYPKGTLPSQVSDVYWLHCLAEGYSEEEVDYDYVGKWMIFGSKQDPDEEGRTQLDRYWLSMEDNFSAKSLYHAKVSTAKKNPLSWNDKSGVICCYTTDFRDTKDVGETAEKIREILGASFDKAMYYKTDNATRNFEYSWNRQQPGKGVSIYRHLPDGTFWSKSSSGWKLLAST